VRKTALRLSGSIALLAFLAYRTDWQRVRTVIEGLDGRFWLAALALQLATQVVSTWRWQMFAVYLRLGGSFRSYLAYYFVGMFFNLVLPTSVGGDVVRAWYLAHHSGSGKGRKMPAFISVLADRVSGVVLLAAVACTAVVFYKESLPPWITGIVAAIGAAALVGVVGLPYLDRALQSPRLPHGMERLRRLTEGGMSYLRSGRLVAATTALSLIVQVNSVLVMALIGKGLGLHIPFLFYGILMPLVTLLTLLPISVNGMGLREASTAILLAPLGVGEPQAITLAFLLFAAQTAAGLVGLIPYLAGGLQRFDARAAAKENKDEDEPPSTAAA
jgi:glycosyltransferase 2 family protein